MMLDDYNEFLTKREKFRNHWMESCVHWLDQTKRYVHPFQIFGNVWYVGDTWVCVHLIDTGDGLLLIDSGNLGAEALLIQAIWEAGFNPADVKWIIHSHGHLDHIGAANFFRNMFGTKLYLGEPDAVMFHERPELSFLFDGPYMNADIFEPDVIIKEGDVLTFGNTTITFRMVPGHTEGCIACFFDACNGDEVRRCGYYGGFGLNTLTKDFLTEIGDPGLTMRETYLQSLAKVRDEKVEIFLGNHTENNQTLERHEKQLQDPEGPNPFIDENQWKEYMDLKTKIMKEFMADPANN